ncbi:hypothetical protein PMAYCL1PPCAC_23593 [Pristionchus mayeri]|uniref:Uncharacterized protein n=1 Tax=Pristionchus mayeri TaxID=1317129 RepID=A0AAN5I5V5_9BILA|nr:hypothetical protein PMAYCL1PPCAC_23593 [Pristionchus mayeri]
MPKDKPSPITPVKTSPAHSKHIDPNDLTVMEGAMRAVESFMATENGREAHLKVRVGFDLVPPEGKDYEYKSSSNLSIDVHAVRNLPRAREDVLKRYEEEKKRIEGIRREKQAKCPTSTRSIPSTTTSSSASSLSDRTQTTRQAAGGDDSQSSSNSTAPTSPFYEGAKNALNDTMLMGTPHDPIHWKKLPGSPNERDETPKKMIAQKATALEIPSATAFAVKGASTAVRYRQLTSLNLII